jgi:hypothetical protein
VNQSPSDKIKDNPTQVKMRKDMSRILLLSKAVAFFEAFGIRNKRISEAMKQIPDLAQLYAMLGVPDRFNEHFSKLGWIAYERLNSEIMQQALEQAENENVALAEKLLTEHYDEKTIQIQLMGMRSIPEFKPRERLLRKALADYVAGRYHACVPVVLAQIDGLVNDIPVNDSEPKGFFAKGASLTAWDSIAAHSSGLQRIARLFSKDRKKTNTQTITIPYRHGIMHGHDLGYDNKLVAAKTWATLFALRDWVTAVRRPPPEPEPKLSFRELLQRRKASQEEMKLLQQWQARQLIVGMDVPSTGQLQDYPEGTPERAFIEFIGLWSRKNYGKMAQLLSAFDQQETNSRTAGWVRQVFGNTTPCEFSILTIEDRAPSVTIIDVEVVYKHSPESENWKRLAIWCVYEQENGSRVRRGNPAGAWRIEISPFWQILNAWENRSND